MSYGDVLFRGTWEEAIRHADEIPPAVRVQVVEVEAAEQNAAKEAFQTVIRQLMRKAEEINAMEEDEARASPLDTYSLALEEKFRRQGFDFQ